MRLEKLKPGWDPPPPVYPGGSLTLFRNQIPLAIIKTYRFIPPSVRSLWSFGGSTSHLALASPTWGTLWRHGRPHLDSYPTSLWK
jgi:hypothetical protein